MPLESIKSLFFYPQFVLGFWGPLFIFGVWRLLRFQRVTLPPKARFWLSWSVLMFPLLALFVPYLPDLVLRDLLPYRVPIAWGVFNSPDITASPFWVVLAVHVPFFLTFGGLLLAGVVGAAEELTAWWRVARLPGTRVGRVRVLHVEGELAFTLGVLRPRVYMSEHVWFGPHREAVLAHEQAHARSRHPLLLAVTRLVARTWWYLPPMWALLREVELTAELLADEAAVRDLGRAKVAHALKSRLGPDTPLTPLSAPRSALTFRTPENVLTSRVQALLTATQPLPKRASVLLVFLYLLLIILL